MSEPIKVGDLVVVVRGKPCCRKISSPGTIFRVEVIGPYFNLAANVCRWCGAELTGQIVAWAEDTKHSYELSMLKKIPPLNELESEDRKQEIEA